MGVNGAGKVEFTLIEYANSEMRRREQPADEDTALPGTKRGKWEEDSGHEKSYAVVDAISCVTSTIKYAAQYVKEMQKQYGKQLVAIFAPIAKMERQIDQVKVKAKAKAVSQAVMIRPGFQFTAKLSKKLNEVTSKIGKVSTAPIHFPDVVFGEYMSFNQFIDTLLYFMHDSIVEKGLHVRNNTAPHDKDYDQQLHRVIDSLSSINVAKLLKAIFALPQAPINVLKMEILISIFEGPELFDSASRMNILLQPKAICKSPAVPGLSLDDLVTIATCPTILNCYRQVITPFKPDFTLTELTTSIKQAVELYLKEVYAIEVNQGLCGATTCPGLVFIRGDYYADYSAERKASVLLTVLHELAHILRRTLVLKTFFRKTGDIQTAEKAQIQEAGDAFDNFLLPWSVVNIYEEEATYLLLGEWTKYEDPSRFQHEYQALYKDMHKHPPYRLKTCIGGYESPMGKCWKHRGY